MDAKHIAETIQLVAVLAFSAFTMWVLMRGRR